MSSSPKRKFDDTELDTEQTRSRRQYTPPRTASISTDKGCDSPRSAVAERLQTLDIRQHQESPSPRKRIKVNNDKPAIKTQRRVNFPVRKQCRDRSSSPVDIGLDESSSPSDTAKKRLRSPPPPSSTTAQQQPKQDDLLTWQLSEITGMSVDFPAGDDGEGINGIGFRPNAQTAYARKQRRKQQVIDWKMREARDARQRRFEKRQQGCKLNNNDSGNDVMLRERSVRFAEML